MNREITGKDMIYFLLLSLILTFCVVIASRVESLAKTPETTTEATTVVQETTTEEVETTEATTEEIVIVEETKPITKTRTTTEAVELTTVKFEDIPELTELGTFKLTAYCACEKCCGKSDGITATGTKAKANHTVAVDPNQIPYGTELYINGNTYIAEDTGGFSGKIIDIYFDSHEEAKNFGIKYAKVFIVG